MTDEQGQVVHKELEEADNVEKSDEQKVDEENEVNKEIIEQGDDEGEGGGEEEEGEELGSDEEYEDETDEEGEEGGDDSDSASDSDSEDEVPPPNPFNEAYFQAKIHDALPTKLNLSGQLLKRSGAFHLSEALKINESITSLRLCRNELGVGGGKFLAACLPFNLTLRRLDLMENHIGEAGARSVAEALVQGTGLEEIYGIDLSPYAHDVFHLSKPYAYEYGNIRLLQHMKVNGPVILAALERQQEAAEEAAAAELERVEREREDEAERARLAAGAGASRSAGSFANLTAGAFDKMGGMFGRKEAARVPPESAQLGAWHQSMDYDPGASDEEDGDKGEDKGDEEQKAQESKVAKSLKLWGK